MFKINRDNMGWHFTVPDDAAFDTDTRNGVPVWTLPLDTPYKVVCFSESLKQAMRVGDRVDWWYCDTSNLPDIYLGGTLTRKSGVTIPLSGHMDAGARTGRPPILRLRNRG